MVSNVFGSALWYLDYNLYVAAETSVARMDFHMGTPYRYSLWQPFDDQPDKTGNLSALIRPSYYGALMLAQALKGGKKVVSLVQQESFVAYGLYGGTDSKLSGIVAVNMNEYNQTASAVARPSVTLSLPESVTKGANVQVRRLTAPGADVKTGETLAGRTVDKSGVITGTEVVEALVSGGVVLKSSEAVLLSFVGAS